MGLETLNLKFCELEFLELTPVHRSSALAEGGRICFSGGCFASCPVTPSLAIARVTWLEGTEELPTNWAGKVREYLSTEYGLRFSEEIYGRKRFSTNTYRNRVCFLEKSSKISGNLREFTGECNLGILYSSSLLKKETGWMSSSRAHVVPH